MKINTETPKHINALLYAAFSSMPLDIEGTNIDFVGWMPSEEDKKYMPLDIYEAEKKASEEEYSKVIFKNVTRKWDTCDCGGGYPCSHDSYVYAIKINNENKTHELGLDDNHICFENDGRYGNLPTQDATIFDLIRMCQLCQIELELSDYAVSLLKV